MKMTKAHKKRISAKIIMKTTNINTKGNQSILNMK